MTLTNKDKRYLERFEKTVRRRYWNYVAVGALFLGCAFEIVLWLKGNAAHNFFVALIFGVLGGILVVVNYVYVRLYKIISALQTRIKELEELR